MADHAQTAALRCGRCRTPLPDGAAFCPECGASTTQQPTPIGPSLPGFEIIRTLGSGGAAEVYLAHQQSLDRDVAVKVLRRGVEEHDATWRAFRREARTVARLSGHPNVVTVYTAGRADTGQPYLVTEYMDRGSLEDVIATEGPLSPATVAAIGAGIADALIVAHALGIHHRDVKPGNVLLASDGRVKLADFGIARLLSGQSVTTTDVYAFTPEHVAPEMLRHEPDGPWSDVYGLASTLATALLGEPPVRRLPNERIDAFLARKLMDPPPTLSAVPAELALPITGALDTDPSRRPTMIEFRDQLASAGHGLGATVPPRLPLAETPAAVVDVSRSAPAAPAQSGGARPLAVVAPQPQLHESRRLALVTALVLGALAAVIVAVAVSGGGDDGGGGVTASSLAASATTPTSISTAVPVLTEPVATTVVPTTLGLPTSSPVTTVETIVTPPVTAATTPPSTAAPATGEPAELSNAEVSSAELSSAEAETFLRSYYADVEAGNYEDSWSQLAPEFQRGKARSFEYYTGFWEANDVEVGEVELLRANAHEATVHVDFRWNGRGPWITEEFTLRPDDAGRWLIAGQTTVDR